MRFSVPSSCACKSLEVLRGLQIRIPLHHHQQPGQGRRKLALGLVKRRQFGRIGRRGVGVKLHLSHRRPGRGDFRERGFLEIGRAGNGRDQIGDEIGPALIDVLHLRPLAVHRLRQSDQVIVTAARHRNQNQHQKAEHRQHTENNGKFFHNCGCSLILPPGQQLQNLPLSVIHRRAHGRQKKSGGRGKHIAKNHVRRPITAMFY